MAKIKIPVGKEAVKEALERGDFEECPPGVYVFKIQSIEDGFTKDSNGKPDKSKRRLLLTLKPVGEGREKKPLQKRYGFVWDNVSFSEDSEWKRAELMLALGKNIKGQGFEIELEEGKPGTDIGKEVLGSVKADADQKGNYKARIARLLPFVEEDAFDDDDESEDDEDIDDDDTESDDADDDESEDDDEDTDEDSEDSDDDDDEDDEDEGYTESELKKMSEKALKRVAKELDLNPAKYKTSAKLIKAILKEQETPFD